MRMTANIVVNGIVLGAPQPQERETIVIEDSNGNYIGIVYPEMLNGGRRSVNG